MCSQFLTWPGKSQEVAKFEEQAVGWNWSLSPDGRSIAAAKIGAGDNRIRLFSLAGQPTRELLVKNWNTFTSLDWAADSKGLFVVSNPSGLKTTLLHVDLAGNAHQLLQVKSVLPTWGIPSRNGKYVAIPVPTVEGNAWMLENF